MGEIAGRLGLRITVLDETGDDFGVPCLLPFLLEPRIAFSTSELASGLSSSSVIKTETRFEIPFELKTGGVRGRFEVDDAAVGMTI